tara:strand:+ start:69 stop:836 length:768 start_codon:yes stop_codon:yes gene_type:complete
MITIKKHNKPELKKCEMLCDNKLNNKLDNYELTSFLNSHTTNLLIGKPKSGKTSLLYSLFQSPKCLKKCFHSIYLFQPSHSRGSMKDKLFDKLPEEQKYEELDEENLQNVINRIKSAEPNENNAIIFDDMTAALKNKETLKLLKELVFNRRHLHTSIFFLVQTWFSVPKDLRKLFSNIFVFKVNKNELETIFEEVIEEPDTLYLMNDIRKIVYDKPFQYLFINTDSQRLFKGFDEIIIDNGDDALPNEDCGCEKD